MATITRQLHISGSFYDTQLVSNLSRPASGPYLQDPEQQTSSGQYLCQSPRQSDLSSGAYAKSFLDAYHDEGSSEAATDHESESAASIAPAPVTEEVHNANAITPSSPALVFGKRYQMSLQLSAEEIELVRHSWSILIDNECSPYKYEVFIKRWVSESWKQDFKYPSKQASFTLLFW